MKPGRKSIILAAVAALAVVAVTGFELRPRHGVCTKRNMMFWRTHVRATRLRDNMYMLQTYGTDLINANTVALVGDEGILLVDPGAPEVLDKERAALPRLKDSRIRFIIDSHAHSDHACANGEAFHQGAIIVGHANVRKFFDTDPWAPPRRTGDTPQVIYDDEMTLRFDGETLHLFHPPLAHTDADTVTVFERNNVVSAGDVFDNGTWPYMKRGSIDGYIAGQERILGFTNDKTIIVPGHGPLARRADLVKSIERFREVRRRIAALIAQGLTREQVVARDPIDDLDPFALPPSARRTNNSSESVAGYVYDSLKRNAAPGVK
jgi:glyoxylase-like metal-dependent hydrolase (beta-lactamase superfamily II)